MVSIDTNSNIFRKCPNLEKIVSILVLKNKVYMY